MSYPSRPRILSSSPSSRSVLLGEQVGLLAWIGIVITVAGASLMSLGPTARARDRGRGEVLAFILLIFASVGFGLSQVFSKMVADSMDVWTLFFWRAIGNGAACVAFTIKPSGMNDRDQHA